MIRLGTDIYTTTWKASPESTSSDSHFSHPRSWNITFRHCPSVNESVPLERPKHSFFTRLACSNLAVESVIITSNQPTQEEKEQKPRNVPGMIVVRESSAQWEKNSQDKQREGPLTNARSPPLNGLPLSAPTEFDSTTTETPGNGLCVAGERIPPNGPSDETSGGGQGFRSYQRRNEQRNAALK
ncbi:hypothetical protein BDR07DRAFT_1071660 [Suillus spraguei]|nr:hypothetical protein BDR07DRAFT_1071660 [Suillus spraguei]